MWWIYCTLVFSALTLVPIQFSCGTTVSRSIRNVRNETTTRCSGLDQPEWTIDSLKYVTIDAWPWSCLLERYDNQTLDSLVTKSSPDIYDTASQGYIGFVQYHVKRRGLGVLYEPRDEDHKTAIQLAIAGGHLNVVKYAVMESSLPAPYFLRLFKEAVYHSQFAIVDYFAQEKTFLPNLHEDLHAVILFAAIRVGNLRMLKYLIEQKGFRVDVKDLELLSKAAESGNLSVMKYFVEEKSFLVVRDDHDLLYSAALGGNVDLLKYLMYERHVTNGTSHRGTMLRAAVQSANLEMVRFVVEQLQYEVNVDGPDGMTPAHDAAIVSLPILEYLVDEKNAHLDALRYNGDSLLHSAAAAGHLANVRYLVERKNVSVELQNYESMTPLYNAVRRGRLPVVRYLAGERKANVNHLTTSNESVLHQAVWSGSVEVMRYLLDDMKMVSRLEQPDSDGRTATMVAAQTDSLKVLKYLVDEKNASTAFMDGKAAGVLWTNEAGQVSARRLATLKYLIEEKRLNFNALPSTDPLKYVYLKYFLCRYNELCRSWYDCPTEYEVCLHWEEYLREMNTFLPRER